MRAVWADMNELRQLIEAGYRPSLETVALVARVADGELVVDQIEIDHAGRSIKCAWEESPTFCS